MRIPEFTGASSLDVSGYQYRRVAAGSSQPSGAVSAQLKGGAFRPRIGAFGTLADYWVCKSGCDAARAACLNTCEGTWENPQGSSNCILCDQDYNACLQNCSRDIA